jgi:hypothetical protein
VTARRTLILAALLAGLVPALASAEPAPSWRRADPHSGFLTQFNFQIGVEALSGSDPRFRWDADVGGDVDVVDYRRGRVNARFNYEIVLADVLQPFDPLFNDYTIDLSSSLRTGRGEIAMLFQHVSRHLGDREKAYGIAWNLLGVELRERRARGRLEWQARGRALGVVMQSSVDYVAELGGDVATRYRLTPLVALTGTGTLRAVFVEDAGPARGHQLGARVEGGVRFVGQRAALELYAALERRVDPDPFDLGPVTWALAGFRVRGLD